MALIELVQKSLWSFCGKMTVNVEINNYDMLKPRLTL